MSEMIKGAPLPAITEDSAGFWEGAAAITRGTPGSCVVESTREPTTGGL